MLPLLKPGLYEVSPGSKIDLKGGRCRCGYVFFPFRTHGCERCGAFGDAITAQPLSGRGTLLAEARVHLHAAPGRSAPFSVVKVRLDEGPVVRTLLSTESA